MTKFDKKFGQNDRLRTPKQIFQHKLKDAANEEDVVTD
jgi:hypothetical protein